ncbi:MAG: ABC transporter ATP-binding protein, partial [Caldimonas sp.]
FPSMNPSAVLAVPSLGSLYRSVWRYAEGVRARLLASTLLLTGSTVIKLALPWLAAQAINTLQQGGAGSVGRAALWVAAILLVYAASWGLHGPGRVLERNVGVRVRKGVADALYAKLTRAPLAWHERQHSGEVQNRVAQASGGLYDFAQNQFIYLQSAVNFAGPIIALALLSTATGWIALAGYVLIGFVILRFDHALLLLAARENQAERRYSASLLEFLGNISTVLSLRLQASTRSLLGRRLDAAFGPLQRTIVLNEMKWCAVDLFSACLAWLLVAVYVWEVHGRGDAFLTGGLFMIYTYAQQAGGVIGSMAVNFQRFAKARTDYANAATIWDAPEERGGNASVDVEWRRIDVVDLGYDHGAALRPFGSAAIPAAANDAAGSGLREVSLTLRRGERVALVGPSGAGKSTLMRVLAGLYEPQHGRFEIDGIAHLGLRHLGSVGTLIPQEADVFEASVRENLTFDMPCDEADLRAAIHTSGFESVLAALPDGLETPIGERGINLSGGQRQRLCLARGLLAARASSLLLLDEPTSALDPLTEADIHARLDAGFGDACIVASVHRMSLLAHFDRVVLMVDGRVVDSGSVAEVEQRQPIFSEMVRSQARLELEVPAETAPAAVAA